MNLEALRTLWQAKFPGGQVWRAGDYANGRNKSGLVVTFGADSKTYTFNTTMRDLAVRYDLIPPLPRPHDEAVRAFEILAQDPTARVETRNINTDSLGMLWIKAFPESDLRPAHDYQARDDEYGRPCIVTVWLSDEWKMWR